jgi:hypothetical protein
LAHHDTTDDAKENGKGHWANYLLPNFRNWKFAGFVQSFSWLLRRI